MQEETKTEKVKIQKLSMGVNKNFIIYVSYIIKVGLQFCKNR